MGITIDKEKCLYCGCCVGSCPTEAMTLYSTWVEVDHDVCIRCGLCVNACPVGSITDVEVGQ